jgi:hypothetical protein
MQIKTTLRFHFAPIRMVSNKKNPGCQWLTTVILAAQEARSGGWHLEASWGRKFVRPYIEKPFTKTGLVEGSK